MPGEDAHAYLRRLARANHLRPTYLRRYLQDPDCDSQPRLDWLAVLAGRSRDVMHHAFTARPTTSARRARRRLRSAAAQNFSTKRSLFTAIRGDADGSGWSVRALADRHGVHRRTIRQALTSPIPPPRKQHRAKRSRLDPFKPVIGALLQEDQGRRYAGRRTIQNIYTLLVDEYGMTGVSYTTLCDYVTNHCRRLALPGQSTISITPTHQAVEERNLTLLRDLLDAGHDIEDDNGDGWTLLRHAIAVEQNHHRETGKPAHADMTAFLLVRGADPRHHGPDGKTPLLDAESRGHWLAGEIIRAWTAQDPAPTSPGSPSAARPSIPTPTPIASPKPARTERHEA